MLAGADSGAFAAAAFAVGSALAVVAVPPEDVEEGAAAVD